MTKASYYFLPWVRYGLLRNAKEMPFLGKQGFENISIPSGRAKILVKLKLNNTDIEGINLSLFGPGDVVSIDSREIVRTEPRHLTPDFLPNLFPFIEFDRPDFPWLFTPGKPDADECLLPWIVLVVLPKAEGTIITNPATSSPELTCEISELPDLKESWAWTHAQYMGASEQNQENIHKELTDKPYQNVSRLICARKLTPNEHYLACVVPAFKVIEKTDQNGLVTSQLEPAWKIGDKDDLISLPVYYQWEFSTAAEGDFEDFITRLKKPDELDEKVKESFFRRMDMSEFLDARNETITLDIISALELETKSEQSAKDRATLKKSQDKLEKKINDSQSPDDNVPLPIYGSWHVKKNVAGIPSLGDTNIPAWLKTLNTDPRYRVAAALGTQIIQRQQEQLMTAAWELATGLDAANQLIRQKQLALEVTNSIFKRIEKCSDATFWQITEPVADAIAYADQIAAQGGAAALRSAKHVADHSGERPLEGKVVVSTRCRRMLRPQGHLLRRTMASDEQKLQLKNYVTARAVTTAILTESLTPIAGEGEQLTPHIGEISPITTSITGIGITEEAVEFLQELSTSARERRMDKLRPDETFTSEMRVRLEISGSKGETSEQRRVAKASFTENRNPMAFLDNVNLSFPQPMYEPLRDLFQEMLIPGLDQIPNNSLVILKTNPAFIEAYMVGLNHEMSRELLWREFPTHLGNTYFQKFWDDRGSGSSSPDISAIRDWERNLGGNIIKEKGDLWMLLIKGDLLIRYPNTIIYAQHAQTKERLFAVLRVNPVPGVTLLGFSLDFEKNGTDWSFVLEEHPTETRFGLDLSREEQEGLKSWRQLIWNDVALRGDSSGYIQLANDENNKLNAAFDTNKATWAKNSAHMAYITLQKPFRYIMPSSVWFSNQST